MSLQNPQANSSNAVHWLHEPDAGKRPVAILDGWLTDSGLLTARMRRLCADGFRLEVLRNTPQQGSSSADTIRRVVLWCGSQACIYAETDLPAATTTAHPWLTTLGDEPLGETLQSRPDVSRGSFEFALLTPAQLPADIPAQINESLWARRSEFFVGTHGLTVTEIFLPGVIECENQRLHIANR